MLAASPGRHSRLLLLASPHPLTPAPLALRMARLTADLAAMGHESVVVSGPGGPALLPVPGVEVLPLGPAPAVRGRHGQKRFDRRGALARWWIHEAVAAAAPVADRVDAIVAMLGGEEAAYAAIRLAQDSGRPWIADLRDPWALDERRVYPSAMHRRRDLQRMRAVLRWSHGIVLSTPQAQRTLLRAFPELALKHLAVVPDGFDIDDFPPGPPPRRRSRTLRVVGPPGTHEALRGALAGVRAWGGARPGEIEVLVVDQRAPAAQRVALLRSADVLFLGMGPLPPSRRSHVVPACTYELLAAGRPLLAALPDGDARDLVAGAPGAVVCPPEDAIGLAHALAHELEHLRVEGRRPNRWHPRLATFERRHIAREYAAVVERIAGTGHPDLRRRPRARLRVA